MNENTTPAPAEPASETPETGAELHDQMLNPSGETIAMIERECYPTPRVDALAFYEGGNHHTEQRVYADDARQIERDLAASQALAARLQWAATGYELTAKALMEAFEFQALPMQCARFAIEKYEALKDEAERLRGERDEMKEALQFVERMVNHHGQKGIWDAAEILSWIQHYPPIEDITKSYSDGKIPQTPNPYEAFASMTAERDDLSRRLDTICTDVDYKGGVQYWIGEHHKVLMQMIDTLPVIEKITEESIKMKAERDATLARADAAEADSRRVDWLERKPEWFSVFVRSLSYEEQGNLPTLRAAIDKALDASNNPP